MKVFNEINMLDETVDYLNLNFISSFEKYTFNFKDFMSLGNLAKNIYNGNVSLYAAKQEQRRMEEKLENFTEYGPVIYNYKSQKFWILPNVKEFYKGRREILIALEENIFPLPKPYVFGKNEWKEKDLHIEQFMPKNVLNQTILERLGHIPLSEKEKKNCFIKILNTRISMN